MLGNLVSVNISIEALGAEWVAGVAVGLEDVGVGVEESEAVAVVTTGEDLSDKCQLPFLGVFPSSCKRGRGR